eukprot:GILI01031476.1.p1 GENE.GILI01031476.1~~GILI01031476.1.p1  ORF type:complete len:233 (+),score=29.39 GILI01031476.1:55-753(+)
MPCNCRHLGSTHEHIVRSSSGAPATAAQHVSLNEYIAMDKVTFYNIQQNRSDALRVIDPKAIALATQESTSMASPSSHGHCLPIVSDADEEALIWIHFTDFVRIKGINIVGPGDSQSPASVKLYSNRIGITGFEAVRRLEPDQRLQLANGPEVSELLYLVDQHKFSSVQNIALFFDSNYGADETGIVRIEFFGETTGQQVDKQLATTLVFESRANPADHPELAEKSQNAAVL